MKSADVEIGKEYALAEPSGLVARKALEGRSE